MLILLFPLFELMQAFLMVGALGIAFTAWIVVNAELATWLAWTLLAAPCLLVFRATAFVAAERDAGVIGVLGGIFLVPAAWFAGSWIRETAYGGMRWVYWGAAALVLTLSVIQLVRQREEKAG